MRSITCAADLVTTPEARIAGFTEQAQKKISISSGFDNEVAEFDRIFPSIHSIDDVWKNDKIKYFFLRACSLSQKSLNHISEIDQKKLVSGIINFKRLADSMYRDELKRNYYLSCGDSLGGSMRNIVGQSAQEKLTNTIIQHLESSAIPFSTNTTNSGKISTITTNNRAYVFDKKPKTINNSIDLIVVKFDSKLGIVDIETRDKYIACGELKGGIDPAGADEHWKTAKTALDRIDKHFSSNGSKSPHLFFWGAAIENAMASEIFALLQSGWLTACANLTNSTQLDESIDMLIKL